MTLRISDIPSLQPVGVAPLKVANLPAKPNLRVLVLPDLHIPAAPTQTGLLLNNREFLNQHDWVVLLGDVTANYGTDGEYEQVRDFIDQLDRPYGVVNGNHEFFFLPHHDDSREYGRRWQASTPQIQRQQFRRFEHFFGIESRFDAGFHNDTCICLLGIDRIGDDDRALLSKEHESWFAQALQRAQDRPMIVFSHFPALDARLESIRYYEQGRKPYLLLPTEIREQLRQRTRPTFWFSGHVHFRPSHPLAQPYLTQDGIWQIHCPDGRGFGRADNNNWVPEHYDGMFACSLAMDAQRIVVETTDLQSHQVVASHSFRLDAC